ncbi:unnamed protein product [Ambrosiozyma monospora]|uniref:Unnamed protein product n=1 Tax=Ambrosiozyma monospora TaxID=43982 RepID=A0A9W6YYJ8_AMBMO|nr:unnamed protein product [Ambrosiozyma monospora]
MQFNKLQTAFFLFIASVNAYAQPEDGKVSTVGDDGAVTAGTPVQKDYAQFYKLLSKAMSTAKTVTVTDASASTATSAVLKRDADEHDVSLTVDPVQKDYSQFYNLLTKAISDMTTASVVEASASTTDVFRRQAAASGSASGSASSSSKGSGSVLQVSFGLGALSAVVLSLL